MNRRLAATAAIGGAAFTAGLLVRSRSGNGRAHRPSVVRSATIARDRADVFAAWRNLPDFPEGERARVWWNGEILDERENEQLVWRSKRGPVRHRGTVTFSDAPGDRGTEMFVEIDVRGGAVLHPQIDADLRRFQSLLEAGDIALNATDVTE